MFNPTFTNTDSSGLRTDRDGHGLSYRSDKGKGDMSRARIKREKITSIEPEDQ